MAKYCAIWIPSGDDFVPGTICVARYNSNPYRLVQYDGYLVFENNDWSYPFDDQHRKDFKPAKLYLCDRNKHVGGRIYNPVTQECFECPNEFYIQGDNNMVDDWNVVAAIDPKVILKGFTPIEEDNIEGYMFGGGDDQLGYIVLTGIEDKHYVKLP